MVHKPAIEAWTQKLATLFQAHNYHPELIFNSDETMLEDGTEKLKVIGGSKARRNVDPQPTKLPHITFLVVISAAGRLFKVVAILPLKTLPPLAANMEQFYFFAGQENGWISETTWTKYHLDYFIPEIDQI